MTKGKIENNVNNEVVLYRIIVKHLSRFDAINKYVNDIQEQISELTEEVIAGCKPDVVIQHCGVISLFVQDIIKHTELSFEDIPKSK